MTNTQKIISVLLSLLLSGMIFPVSVAAALDVLTGATASSVVSTELSSTLTDANAQSSGAASAAAAAAPEASSATDVPSSATTSTAVTGAAMTVQAAEDATGISAADEGTAYAPGQVIVVYRDGTTRAEATQVVQATSTVTTDAITDGELLATTVEGDTLTPETGDEPMAMVDVADDTTVVQAVAELETDPNVAYAQPNYRYELMDDGYEADLQADAAVELTTFGETLAEQSTSIDDTYGKLSAYWQYHWQLNAISTGYYGIDCYDAWDYARCGGSVGVAVVDTGCLTTHEDLADNIVGTYNAVTKTSGSSAVSDAMGHGTHVCGIIAAEANNGLGVAGISYNAGIVPIKAVSDNGYFYTSSLVEAYNYIIKNYSTYNIKVVNMSLGGSVDSESAISSDDALLKLVDTANSIGILTVCAAGNQTFNTGYASDTLPYYEYPGDYSTCVSVISTTSGGVRNSSSNYTTSDIVAPASATSDVNGTKDIAAPGTSIYSTYSGNASSYAYLSGTSMASPVVAGAAALVFAANGSLTPAEVKTVLYETATDLGTSGWDCYYGWGLVNAYYAVADARGLLITSDDCTVSDMIYTGLPLKTTVTVNGKVLSEGTDYTATYTDNTNVGTATVVIAGVGGGGYAGTVTKTFAINAAAVSTTMSDATISGISKSYVYRGSAYTPSPTVNLNGTTLVNGVDYTVSYTDNVEIGTATITVSGMGIYSGSVSATFAIVRPATVTPVRLWGQNALGTMSAIVDAGFTETGGTVVLATGAGFWDALTASGIAGFADAPILLTSLDGKTLSAQTITELARLKPSAIIVCGGTAAVSDALVNQAVKASGSSPKTTRCAGGTATATADDIYAEAVSSLGYRWSDTAFVATGSGYWDSLSIAPYAYARHCPIFLTSSAGGLDDATTEAMSAGGVNYVYLLGGTAAVPETVSSQLSAAGIVVKGRIAGTDAVGTSQAVATFEVENGMRANRMAAATNTDFYDALTGAALCGKNSSVLILLDGTGGGNTSTLTGFVSGNKASIGTAYIFGGTAAVSSASEAALSAALG